MEGKWEIIDTIRQQTDTGIITYEIVKNKDGFIQYRFKSFEYNYYIKFNAVKDLTLKMTKPKQKAGK